MPVSRSRAGNASPHLLVSLSKGHGTTWSLPGFGVPEGRG